VPFVSPADVVDAANDLDEGALVGDWDIRSGNTGQALRLSVRLPVEDARGRAVRAAGDLAPARVKRWRWFASTLPWPAAAASQWLASRSSWMVFPAWRQGRS
jgi:hypothetical protein